MRKIKQELEPGNQNKGTEIILTRYMPIHYNEGQIEKGRNL